MDYGIFQTYLTTRCKNLGCRCFPILLSTRPLLNDSSRLFRIFCTSICFFFFFSSIRSLDKRITVVDNFDICTRALNSDSSLGIKSSRKKFPMYMDPSNNNKMETYRNERKRDIFCSKRSCRNYFVRFELCASCIEHIDVCMSAMCSDLDSLMSFFAPPYDHNTTYN